MKSSITTLFISLVVSLGVALPVFAANPTPTSLPAKPVATVVKPAVVKPTATAKPPVAKTSIGSAVVAIAAFRAAKLEAGSPIQMMAKDYGKAPTACNGIAFLLPAQGQGVMGQVFYCPSTKDQDDLKVFYTKQNAISNTQTSRTYLKGNYLLQMDGKVKAAQARKYVAAIPNENPQVVQPAATAAPTNNAMAGIAPKDANTCPPDHAIKGNKSSKIYHVVNDSSYKETKPEVCFATIANAQAAGYRAPKK